MKRTMKKLLPLVLLALCCSCVQAKPPKPLLWKVSDGNNSVYLLGSFHALKPDDYPLADSVEAAFADAERVAFELSPEELQSPMLVQKMMMAAVLPAGTSLQQQMTPAEFAQLQAYASKHDLNLANYDRLEPWFMSLVISSMEMQQAGLDPKQGLDQHLMARAAEANKATLGLETADEQIAALDSMSAQEQQQALAEALDTADDFKAEIDRLHAQWRAGNDKALYAEMGAKFKAEYPGLYQRIDVDRNNAWLPKIHAMLDQESETDTLVVVGSLHLLGREGLVAQLKAKGYKVERL